MHRIRIARIEAISLAKPIAMWWVVGPTHITLAAEAGGGT